MTRFESTKPPEALRVPPPINPGPPQGQSRKIRDVTGPGLTTRFGMEATDLGVMARTPSGRILAVFGDTFRDRAVGSRDWRAPVALFADTKDLDGGIGWDEAAGGDPHYARQLWSYDHVLLPDGQRSTVLPFDIITVGNTMYLYTMACFPFPDVHFTEIWKSTDNGRTWSAPGPQLWRDDLTPPPHNRRWQHGLRDLEQQWTWDVGRDGYVYVYSTGFQRDKPIILRRVLAENILDWNAYEGWGSPDGRPDGWAWGNEPTPVLDAPTASGRRGPGGYGEMCLRRIKAPDSDVDHWAFLVFNAFEYNLELRVLTDPTNDLYHAPMNTPIRGTDWDRESDDAVAQLYGPSIVPGSRLDAGFHILLSQWHNVDVPGSDNTWPYHVMQFKIPVPGF